MASVTNETLGCVVIDQRLVDATYQPDLSLLSTIFLNWVRDYAREHYEKPPRTDQVVILEVDEMWHYLKKISKTLDLESH